MSSKTSKRFIINDLAAKYLSKYEHATANSIALHINQSYWQGVSSREVGLS